MPGRSAYIGSWGRYPRVSHESIIDMPNRHSLLPETGTSILAYGNGRSYGDVCLNEEGTLVRTRRMDHFIDFDSNNGKLKCESGVLIKDILDLAVPRGWFLPVTPGTRYVTVGGAIANDVHGKNHHIQGSFGNHVLRFELLGSDGERKICSPAENPEWFASTVGGLGLTGLITWVELRLVPVKSNCILYESQRFGNLDEFWQLNQVAEAEWEYTVGWLDCLAVNNNLGRGIFTRGSHVDKCDTVTDWVSREKSIPLDPPVSLVNSFTLRAFNMAYYHRPLNKGSEFVHYIPFLYPLDHIHEWNRLYGSKGFFQYQCVLPGNTSRDGLTEILRLIAKSGTGSFLAVLKTFGEHKPVGMLSFPRPGATLALDFPNLGCKTQKLFQELDAVVQEAGGALYPAKDACMNGELFRSGFPQWEQFSKYMDPGFSSSFWRRVTR